MNHLVAAWLTSLVGRTFHAWNISSVFSSSWSDHCSTSSCLVQHAMPHHEHWTHSQPAESQQWPALPNFITCRATVHYCKWSKTGQWWRHREWGSGPCCTGGFMLTMERGTMKWEELALPSSVHQIHIHTNLLFYDPWERNLERGFLPSPLPPLQLWNWI